MKPVHQIDFGDGTGDCLAACIASILELPLSAVPNFNRKQTESGGCMVEMADQWLRKNHGRRFISIELYHCDGPATARTDQVILNRLYHANSDELVILSGESPRKNANGTRKYHAVVGQLKMWGFDIVHDPHPEGGGIVGQPYGVKWIVPLPPAA